MSSGENTAAPSQRAVEECRANALRVRANYSAERLWERCLTSQDRERLGGDLEDAFKDHGTAGMWMKLRGVTWQRAVVDVAKTLGFLTNENYEWLLGQIGEILGIEEELSRAIAARDFVLVDRPREAYWSGERIEIDWDRHEALWIFLWELGRQGKANRPIDVFTFGEHAHRDLVTQRKHRLTSMPEFPADLADLIEVVAPGTQQLRLPPEEICIFALSGIDTLSEWNP